MSISAGPVLCQQTAGGTDGRDDLCLAAAAGFRRVSLHDSRLAGDDADGWVRRLADAGLTAVGYMSVRDILAGAPAAGSMITLAAQLGARHVVVTTGPLRGLSPARADARCAEWFARHQPVADEAGVRLALEPLHPRLSHLTYVHDLAHADRIVRDVPGAGVVLDTGHLWWDEGLLAGAERAAQRLVCVQLADVDPEALRAGGYGRCGFGRGVVPNAALVRGLRATGFTGPYELETRGDADGAGHELARARRWAEEVIGA